MTERIVKVSVIAAVSSYLSGMDQVTRKAQQSRTEAEKLTAALEAQKKAFQITSRAMFVAGGVVAAGLTLAIAKAADFDQAMSNVEAATHESASNMKLLRDAAIEAGAKTVFSARESADAIEELAKAGLSTKDIVGGGLKGALDLAAAGGLGVADAAGVASTTLKQFGLEGDKAGHVADVLAAGAGKAMGDVSDLSQALAQSGTVSAQFGLSLDETVGSLAAFASKGLLGSDAGTSFRSMLLRLANPTGEAAKLMKSLGINAYDASGQFVGMESLAGQLQSRLGGLTQEQRNANLAIIFGQDAIRAANVLYTEGGQGIKQWTDDVNDAGYAGETAALRLNNLKGDLEQLGGAFDSAMISIGESGQGPLRMLVQGITELLDTFNEMPDGAKQAVFWVGAVGSAVLLAGGLFFAAVPKIAAYNAAILTLPAGAQRADRALRGLGRFLTGPWGVALAAGAVAVAALQQALKSVQASSDEMANSIRTATRSADEIFATAAKGKEWGLQFDVLDRLKDLKGTLDGLIESDQNLWKRLPVPGGGLADKYGGAAQALRDVGAQLATIADTDAPSAARAFRLIADETDGSNRQLWALLANMPDYQDALIRQATAQGINLSAMEDSERHQALLNLAMDNGTSAADEQEAALRELAGQAGDASSEVQGLEDAIRNFGKAQFDTNAATRAFESAIDDAAEAAKKNGKTLDLGTEKGRANSEALDEIASSALNLSAAIQHQTGDQDKAAAALARGREEFVKTAMRMGKTREEAEKYADSLGLIPSNVKTTVQAITAPADKEMQAFLKKWSSANIKVRVATTATGNTSGSQYARANGGILPGPPSRKDNMLIHAASGEFVVNSAATTRNRALLEWINSGGNVQALANGGIVGARSDYNIALAAQRAAQQAYNRALAESKAADKAESKARGTAAKKRAKAKADKADEKLRKAKSKLSDTNSELKSATSALQNAQEQLLSTMDDWNKTLRRDEASGMGGLSLVDKLLALSEDTGGAPGAALKKAALASESAFLSLGKESDATATKLKTVTDVLDDLKSKAVSMAQSVAQAVRGLFNPSSLAGGSTTTVTDAPVTVGGFTYTASRQVTTGPTAGGISSSLTATATRMKAFADKLSRLAQSGLDPAFLAEIASLGVENGEPIVDALLTATSSEIAAINASYGTINNVSAAAGQTVADANFKTLIEQAQAQVDATQAAADLIAAQLAAETNRIIAAITSALTTGVRRAGGGVLPGAPSSSDNMLIHAASGEFVVNSSATAKNRAVLDYINRGGVISRYARGGFVRPIYATPSQAISSTGAAAGAPSGRELHVHINNPVTNDIVTDARRAAGLMRASGLVD